MARPMVPEHEQKLKTLLGYDGEGQELPPSAVKAYWWYKLLIDRLHAPITDQILAFLAFWIETRGLTPRGCERDTESMGDDVEAPLQVGEVVSCFYRSAPRRGVLRKISSDHMFVEIEGTERQVDPKQVTRYKGETATVAKMEA